MQIFDLVVAMSVDHDIVMTRQKIYILMLVLKICQKCVCRVRSGPRWRSLQHFPTPLAGFKGPTSNGRGGEGSEGWEGMGRKRKGREGGSERGGKRSEGEGGREVCPSTLSLPSAARAYNKKTVRIFILKFQIDCPLYQLDFIIVLVRRSM